jgi:hypothetical protein
LSAPTFHGINTNNMQCWTQERLDVLATKGSVFLYTVSTYGFHFASNMCFLSQKH